MKVKDKNNSSLKTKELIKRTSIEMLHDMKDSNLFTVSELCRRANINRSTFYTHYDGIGDVIAAVQNDVLTEFFRPYALTSKEDILQFFEDVMEVIEKNEESYSLMLASDEPIEFLQKMRVRMFAVISECRELRTMENSQQLELNLRVFLDGMFEQFMAYLRGTSPYTIGELKSGLSHTLETLLYDDVNP